jgi:CheY-like chemotaxis protein
VRSKIGADKEPHMPLLLVLEDTVADSRKAVDIARAAGFTEFEVVNSPTRALVYIEKALDKEVPLPDGMIVDLELGRESGFELVRFWHRNPRLRGIPVIIWTIMGDEQREICGFFGVSRFVSKYDSPDVLTEALMDIISGAGKTEPVVS